MSLVEIIIAVCALIFLSTPPVLFSKLLSFFYLPLASPLTSTTPDTGAPPVFAHSPMDPWEIFPPAGPMPSPAHT